MSSRRPLRIVTPSGKFVYFFLAMIAQAALVVLAWLVLGERAALVIAGPLTLVWVAVAVRVFRDPDVEPYRAPRAWWRLTARPTSGFVVGGLFLARSAQIGVTELWRPDGWLLLPGIVLTALAGIAFLLSSLRLRAGAAGRLA